MKKEFYVTESAGRDVAGMTSPGYGNSIMLSEGQAEHALRLGHLSREPVKVESSSKAAKGAGSTKRKPS